MDMIVNMGLGGFYLTRAEAQRRKEEKFFCFSLRLCVSAREWEWGQAFLIVVIAPAGLLISAQSRFG